MALILNLETATKNCSVSLSKDGEIIAIRELISTGYSHAEKLHPFIDEVMKEAELKLNQLDAVSVSMGPGSYTGLRIGVSAAKGICFANEIPLIAIPTLDLMASSQTSENKILVPMLDARRMEVYSSVYKNDLSKIRDTQAEIIDQESFSDLLKENELLFFGDGANKCKTLITSPNAYFKEDIFPSSKFMGSMSEEAFSKSEFVDVAYFEPFYLKDFIVTKSLKKPL